MGELDVTFESFRLSTDADQVLVTYTRRRGSETERRLRELGALPVVDADDRRGWTGGVATKAGRRGGPWQSQCAAARGPPASRSWAPAPPTAP